MFSFRRFLLPSVLLIVSIAHAADPGRFAGHWNMTVEGKYSKDLTIEQSGSKLDGVVKEDWGYVHFKGSTSGKRSFQLVSVGGENQSRQIRIEGKIDEDGMLSGSLIVEDAPEVSEDRPRARPSSSSLFIALRKE